MKRSKIVPSAIVLAFALSSCAGTDIEPPVENTLAQAGPADIGDAITQAQAQRAAGDLNAATATLSQLVLIAPDDPRVLAEYGKTLIDKGELSDALAFLQRAIELNPGDWKYHSAQGVAFAQTRNYRSASIAFSRALALSPNEPTVLNNFALAQMQAGNLDQAEALLLRASAGGTAIPQITQNLAMVRELKAAQAGTQHAVAAAAPSPVETAATESSATPETAAPETAAAEAAPVPAPEPVDVAEIAPVAAATPQPAAEPLPDVAAIPEPVAEPLPVSSVGALQDAAAISETEPEPSPVAPVEPLPDAAAAEPAVQPEPVSMPHGAPTALARRAELMRAVQEGRAVIQALPEPEAAEDESAILSVTEPEASDIWLPASGPIYLQVGAFSSAENAGRFADGLAEMQPRIVVSQVGERQIHRVGVGPYSDRAEARLALAQLEVMGISDVQVLTSFVGGAAAPSEESPVEPLAQEPEETPEGMPALRFSDNR